MDSRIGMNTHHLKIYSREVNDSIRVHVIITIKSILHRDIVVAFIYNCLRALSHSPVKILKRRVENQTAH